MKKRMLDLLTMSMGAFIFALAINLFVIPHHFGEGGVTGVTIILYYLFAWSPGLVNLIINAILLIVGYTFLDKQTTIYTIMTVLLNSLFLHLTATWRIPVQDLMLNAIFGGIFAGIGLGLIIRVGSTTAGTTILAKIMNKYWDWNVSYALLFLDLMVAFSAYFIIGTQSLMFTIVMLYIGTKVMDFIIEGLNCQKAVTIISKKHQHVAEQVNMLMGRGVTVLSGYGYYTKEQKEILYIIINRQELATLKKIVQTTDKNAFITIHDVRNVFGEGFIDLNTSWK